MPKKSTKKAPPKVKKSKPTKKVGKKNSIIVSKVIGLILIVLALAILLLPLDVFIKKEEQRKSPIVISSELTLPKEVTNTPVKVVIPKVEIDLPIVESHIVDGYWELSENTASYGLGSGYPGSAGNTVIFAHAREGLFYNLKDVKVGDIIYVLSKDKWFRYKINKITAVYPNQIETVQPTKNETLTLYTCTGFNDEKRLIVTALPEK